jgi:hypothetical protein
MLNFYSRFLPHAAATHVPLYNTLSGTRVKGCRPITWTPDFHRAFEECKVSLSRAALRAHPDPAAPHVIVTDASTSAMGAVLQQRTDVWQLLALFSKKLNPAKQKYSAYDPELLAVYEVVKHFRHMLEARHFIIFMYYNTNRMLQFFRGLIFQFVVHSCFFWNIYIPLEHLSRCSVQPKFIGLLLSLATPVFSIPLTHSLCLYY